MFLVSRGIEPDTLVLCCVVYSKAIRSHLLFLTIQHCHSTATRLQLYSDLILRDIQSSLLFSLTRICLENTYLTFLLRPTIGTNFLALEGFFLHPHTLCFDVSLLATWRGFTVFMIFTFRESVWNGVTASILMEGRVTHFGLPFLCTDVCDIDILWLLSE